MKNKLLVLAAAVEDHRAAHVRWENLVVSENSMGFHFPVEVDGELANGVPPYAWVVISGSLPPGLSLNVSSGTISGTPTVKGTFTFTAQVTDSSPPPAKTTSKAFTLSVR